MNANVQKIMFMKTGQIMDIKKLLVIFLSYFQAKQHPNFYFSL